MICKHRVMDRCKKDNRLCFHSPDCFEPEEIRQETNADHIRAMSDEELEEFLFMWALKCPQGGILDWLKQPYGGDTHV